MSSWLGRVLGTLAALVLGVLFGPAAAASPALAPTYDAFTRAGTAACR